MVPVPCGAAPESRPLSLCGKCVSDVFPHSVFFKEDASMEQGMPESVCKVCSLRWGMVMLLSSSLGFGCSIGSCGGPLFLGTLAVRTLVWTPVLPMGICVCFQPWRGGGGEPELADRRLSVRG